MRPFSIDDVENVFVNFCLQIRRRLRAFAAIWAEHEGDN